MTKEEAMEKAWDKSIGGYHPKYPPTEEFVNGFHAGYAALADRLRKAEAVLENLRGRIASDAYAITFQSIGQYRTALLKEDL